MIDITPSVSVVIPTYNREQDLFDSIDCVLANTYPNFEVLVVDQTEGHTTESASTLREYARHDQIRYTRLSVSNLPLARNVGLRLAEGEIVIFVDDDVELGPSFIATHVQRYEDSSVHAVGGRVLSRGVVSSEDGVGSTEERPPPPGRITINGELIGNFWQSDYDGHPIDWGLGCNMSFRRAPLIDIGGFDERYTGSAVNEEVDAFIRLNDAGYNAIFAPDASLIHKVAPTGGCRNIEDALKEAKSVRKNRCLYATKTLKGLNWLRYITQEVESSYSFVRMKSLDIWSFTSLISSIIQGILIYYKEPPNIHTLEQLDHSLLEVER